jgi:uncharacterized membrane protein YphA (DoxX/SURF4 family)
MGWGWQMKAYIVLIIRIFLGLVFLLSGISKLLELSSFTATINNFQIVPLCFSKSVAIVLACLESGSGLMLLLGFQTKVSSGIVVILLIIFLAAIIPVLATGQEMDCGCFGSLSHDKVGSGLLVRDVILLGLAAFLFVEKSHKWSLDNVIEHGGLTNE